jgi:hypothetical protein
MTTPSVRIKKCFHDAHDIDKDAETFTFPVEMTLAKTTLSPLVFCSLECVKSFLCNNALLNANRLEMFCTYVFKKYSIEENIFPNPDPMTLMCFRSDDTGISIEEFRKNNGQHTFGIENLSVSQCIATDESVMKSYVVKLEVSTKQLDEQYKMKIHTDQERTLKKAPSIVVNQTVHENFKKKRTYDECNDDMKDVLHMRNEQKSL